MMDIIWAIGMLIICVAFLVVYVYTLVEQAKGAKWVWFVLTLLTVVTMFVYWIVKLFK